MGKNDNERIEHIFKYMEYDVLTDAQHTFVADLESFFERNGYLTDNQFYPLEDIFSKAAERV